MTDMTRKEFLKFGAALPLAMHSLSLSAAVGPKSPPRRIIFICNSLGFYDPYFAPKTRGDLGTSEYLKGMRTRDKMSVIQNLYHPGMNTSNHDSEKSILTGAPKPESSTFVNTISVDQVLAQHMGSETRFPYLAFSIYDRGWGCSWNSRGSAIPPMHDDAQIFNKLFGKEDLAAKKQQIMNDQNILAALYRDMDSLKRKKGQAGKLETYRSVAHELEAQLKHEEFWLNMKKPVVPNSLSTDKQYAFSTKVSNMLELAKLAFQTDSTRVITFAMDWIYGAIKVPGVTSGWHTLSHHGNKPDMIKKLSTVERDIVKNLDQFLFDLDQIPEGGGSLLDNTTVVIGSSFGDASNHTCNNLPSIVAGGGYKHQGHTFLEQPTHLCNLYLELLHKHNIDAASFGNSEENMGLLGA